MQLTRLRLDLRNAQVRRDLADPYEMHRTLVRAFVDDASHAPPRILWRLEPFAQARAPELLVQSPEPGDWSFLDPTPGYLLCVPETKRIDDLAWLQAGLTCRFRLFANPTVTRDGKRQGILGEDAQLAWLARQGQRHGFSLDGALVTVSDQLEARKKAMRITLRRACFEGRLTITDADAARTALCEGIGPGKALGLGLLSIARR